MIPVKPCVLAVLATNLPLNFGPLSPGLLVRGLWFHLYCGGLGANYTNFAVSLTKAKATTTAMMKEGDVLAGPDPTSASTLPRIGTALLADGGGTPVFVPLNIRIPPDRPWLSVQLENGDSVYGFVAIDADQPPGA